MRILYLVLAVLALAANGHAQWSVSADVSRLFGNTTYRLDALTVSPANPNDVYPIASELVFPLDVWVTRLKADWQLPGGKWNLAASLAMNTNDPSRKMEDSDWERGSFVQYTESDAALNMLKADLDVRRLIAPGTVPISLVANLGYEKISQDIIGFQGWYFNETLQRRVAISGTGPALNYDVTYLSGQAGLAATASLPLLLSLKAQSTAGIVYARDTDDHLLRGRRAVGDATGFGSRSFLEIGHPLFRLGAAPVTLGVRGELDYFRADGTVTETWYRTEQTPNWTVPAGTTYADIPHSFRSTQSSVGLSLGIEF